MTMQPTNLVEFMVRLKKIDQAVLTQRDILIMWVVHENPGVDGLTITRKIGMPSRSRVQTNILRLTREGYLRDDRPYVGRAVSNILHLTDKGRKFWEDLVS